MNWFNVGQLLALGQPPTPAGTQADPRGQMLSTIGMLVIMVVMFYFVLIRPQSKKAKEHAQMLKTIDKGDKIVAAGGLVCKVVTVKDDTLTVMCSDSKLEVRKSAITDILERAGKSNQS